MNKKLLWISDMSVMGSGYLNITTPLAQGLAERGYQIKILGIGYKGEQHPYDFSVIPVKNENEAVGSAQNIFNYWDKDTDKQGFDACVVALDIPYQERFLKRFDPKPFKYVGIMPIEAPPLSMSWAMALMEMDKQFIISQFGTDECQRMGIASAEHIQIGIDTQAWRVPIPEERKALRDNFGLQDETFVVLTVADNQERKNLSRSLEIFADFLYQTHYVTKEKIKDENLKPKVDARYILVTREHLPVGWRLRDLAQDLGISQQLMIFERGIPFNQLWMMYALSDVFLLTSKCEGLNMPILESMATGLPVLGTACTGIGELLAGGRGTLIEPMNDPDLNYTDPFGNSRRWFARRSDGYEKLTQLWQNKFDPNPALEYVQQRDWKQAIDLMDNYFRSLDG